MRVVLPVMTCETCSIIPFIFVLFSGWVRVVLQPVTREAEGNLGFSFRDTQCPWWKGGILFDFIELRKIS